MIRLDEKVDQASDGRLLSVARAFDMLPAE